MDFSGFFFWIFPDFSRVFSGVEKSIFYDFFYDAKIDFLREKGPEIWESRVRRPGNLE